MCPPGVVPTLSRRSHVNENRVMDSRREPRPSLLTPVVLVVATWVVTQLAQALYRRRSGPGSRKQVRQRREESTVYSVLLASALALTEFAVTRAMAKPSKRR